MKDIITATIVGLVLGMILGHAIFANAMPTSEVGRLVWNPCSSCQGYYVYWGEMRSPPLDQVEDFVGPLLPVKPFFDFSDGRRYKILKPDITSLMIKDITTYGQERCFSMTTFRGDLESNFCEEKCLPEGVDGLKVQLIFEMEVGK